MFEGFINSKEQRTEHRVQQHSIYSTVGKPIAMMFTEAITSMFTKTSVFTYYNITMKQRANKGVNYNKFLYTVNSNLQDSIYSVCIMSHTKLTKKISLPFWHSLPLPMTSSSDQNHNDHEPMF